MQLKQISAAIVVSLLALGIAIGATEPKPIAFLPADDKLALLDKMEAEWSKIDRWLIEYEAVPALKKPGWPSLHRVIAVGAPGDLYHLGAHFTNDQSWRNDPFCQEYFIHARVTCHRWPFNRIYTQGVLEKGNDIPGSFPAEFLLAIIPNWPLSDYQLPADGHTGLEITPPKAVRSKYYRLFRNSEQRSHHDCVVFDNNGVDRIWIAKDLGFCVMGRERRSEDSKRLLYRVRTQGVTKVASGLWFPTDFEYELFAHDSERGNILEQEYRIHVLRCDLGRSVPESTFVPVQPAGSLEYSADEHFVQVVPGGQNLLDDIARFTASSSGHDPQPFAITTDKVLICLWPIIAFSGGLCLGGCIWGIKRRQSGPESVI